jgi:hypothetical protein
MIRTRLAKTTFLATLAIAAVCCIGWGGVLASPPAPPQDANQPAAQTPIGQAGASTKAPLVIPSKPFDLLEARAGRNSAAPMVRPGQSGTVSKRAGAPALVSDTTAPTGPTLVTASAQSLVTLNAQWSGAQDPESGVSYYIYGIGTLPTGDYSTLANIKWWQVTYDSTISVSMNLDPTLTYYVSVYAVNGAGASGSIVTSNAVHPVWATLGQAGNVLQIRFADTGYDASGNPTAGFTPDQIATMSSFYGRMQPILAQLYGPPAVSYTVTIVRDLRYRATNQFIPSTKEIRMSDGFYPQLFTHELIHAFRNVFLLTSDQSWNFDPTLSGFEEGFAQGVSYEAMNLYVENYPNDPIVPGNSLWGSTYDWDYDFQNVPELRGTSFWSDGGGTLLYWTKYEMAAAAIRKINIESPGFYARFNQEYYSRINANPTIVRPTQTLISDIIRTLVPTIEGVPAAAWIDQQSMFYDRNVFGEKIFHQIQDYPWTQLFAFQNIHFLETMSCGSEWACWDGQKWVYYDLNGSQGTGTLVDGRGSTVWSGTLQIQPTTNPSDGNYVIGYATKGLTTAASLQPWPGGSEADYVMGLTSLALYRFDTTFTDPNNGTSASNSIYRVMGSAIANDFRGVWGGVVGDRNGIIYLDHEGYPAEPGIPVVDGAFAGLRSWTGVPNARTGGYDSAPGRVFATFVDGDTGATYHAQRNIDYGSSDGNQMFLFDFSGGDTAGPSVSVTSPQADAIVFGPATLAATASDASGIGGVRFLLDGMNVGAPVTTAPYSLAWDSTAVADGTHTLQAIAVDSVGNSTTSGAVSFVTANDPPAVSVTSPTPGTALTGTVPVTASASSGSGIAKVDLYQDGSTLIGTASVSPYTVNWATGGLAQGSSHTLTARAYAGNGRLTVSAPITVSIKDTTAPVVSVTAPRAAAAVSNSTTISAGASDNVGVTRVEFYVDGNLLATDSTAPYSASWNPATVALGAHSLTARAYDQAGNSATSAAVSVKVTDTTAPTVSLTSPAAGSAVSRSTTVTIAAAAADNRAVSRVDFYVNNALKCSDAAAPYSCNWSVPSQRGARYTLSVKAHDSSNNTATSSVAVTSK